MNAEKRIEDLVKAEKREYYRQYRAKNKERVNANNRRYWERRALERQRQQEESEGKKHDEQQ